jgi:hypothetical protein
MRKSARATTLLEYEFNQQKHRTAKFNGILKKVGHKLIKNRIITLDEAADMAPSATPKKRKQVKGATTTSSNDEDDDNDQEENDQSPGKGKKRQKQIAADGTDDEVKKEKAEESE